MCYEGPTRVELIDEIRALEARMQVLEEVLVERELARHLPLSRAWTRIIQGDDAQEVLKECRSALVKKLADPSCPRCLGDGEIFLEDIPRLEICDSCFRGVQPK